jgi:hypothetical protein
MMGHQSETLFSAIPNPTLGIGLLCSVVVDKYYCSFVVVVVTATPQKSSPTISIPIKQ